MNATREIITFQFGNYSNYIGAHWWNLQESSFNYDPTSEPSEVNHDILYREGVDLKGQTTFTPRLLLVDLDGSFRHLPEDGEIYNDIDTKFSAGPSTKDKKIEIVKTNILWDPNQVEVVLKPDANKPEFKKDLDNLDFDIEEKEYNLSESVETWTDYLYTRYHPRSLNIVKDYKISNEKETFDTFSNGSKLWHTDYFEAFSDNIRQYIEECDNCQGFQTIFDCSNGFSGLALQCMEHLNDEYSKVNFAIPVFSPKSILFENADEQMTNSIRVVNIAATYSNLIEQSSLFVPLSIQDRAWRQLGSPRKFPYINYDVTNLYQSSAILASFLDTITLRYRLKTPTYSSYLSSFCSDLTNHGRKLAGGALSLPFPMRADHDLIDCLDKLESTVFTQISPNTNIGTDYVIQSACIRGIDRNRLKKPLHLAQTQMKMSAYKCDSISEMLQLYFQCEYHASLAHVSAVPTPLGIRKPYPVEIFDSRLNPEGFLRDYERNSIEEKLRSIPTVASIQSSGDLSNTVESLHREANRVKISKLHRFKETGMESDDYSEILESLLQFKDRYEDNLEW